MTISGHATSNNSAMSRRSCRPIKHKSKDKPKRPLSAYNYFFSEERMKIIKAVNCEDIVYRKEIDPDLDEELIEKLRKGDGKVSFEELGRLIGSRWKEVKFERLAYFKSLAEDDKKRYAVEVEAHKQRQEETRYEDNNVSTKRYHAHNQDSRHTAPIVERHPAMFTQPATMYGGYSGHMPTYHVENNSPYSYGHMPMTTGTHNSHYSTGLTYYVDEVQHLNDVPSQNINNDIYGDRYERYPSYAYGPSSVGFSQSNYGPRYEQYPYYARQTMN